MGQQLHLAGMDSGMAFIITQIAIVVDRTTSRLVLNGGTLHRLLGMWSVPI
jgi:hypothetical protein